MRDNAAREWFDGPLGWRVLREEAALARLRRKLEAAEEEVILRYARNYLGYKEDYLKER